MVLCERPIFSSVVNLAFNGYGTGSLRVGSARNCVEVSDCDVPYHQLSAVVGSDGSSVWAARHGVGRRWQGWRVLCGSSDPPVVSAPTKLNDPRSLPSWTLFPSTIGSQRFTEIVRLQLLPAKKTPPSKKTDVGLSRVAGQLVIRLDLCQVQMIEVQPSRIDTGHEQCSP